MYDTLEIGGEEYEPEEVQEIRFPPEGTFPATVRFVIGNLNSNKNASGMLVEAWSWVDGSKVYGPIESDVNG